MRAVILLFVLSACDMPDPQLTYAISDDPAQSCGTTNCAEVIVPCDAVISIRIFRPGDEAAPIVTVCEPLPQNRGVHNSGNLRLKWCVQPSQRFDRFRGHERRALVDILREAGNVVAGVGGEILLQRIRDRTGG